MVSPDSPTNRDTANVVEPLVISAAKVEAAPTTVPSPPSDHHAVTPNCSLSLAEMAEHDLDAALQLLAERAQYITGASGAAIALRRGRHNDMLCRASTGASAPELGTLLSMEYGFTGESVRTLQTLFCKDAETDSRVNREGCRKLGIASVVAMPIICEGQALGVFELFSGKPSAFVERDFAALRRLGEMVETAVKHAAAESVTMQDIAGESAAGRHETFESSATISVESSLSEAKAGAVPVSTSDSSTAAENDSEVEEKTEVERSAQKPLYWSAAMRTEGGQAPAPETRESIPVPAVLRDLKKCKACGFPVSQGRTLCVECEEKQWRGQLAGKSDPAAGTGGL